MSVCIMRCMNQPPITEQRLREVLGKNGGSPTRAAEEFGVSRVTVYRWMRRFGIEVKRVVEPA